MCIYYVYVSLHTYMCMSEWKTFMYLYVLPALVVTYRLLLHTFIIRNTKVLFIHQENYHGQWFVRQLKDRNQSYPSTFVEYNLVISHALGFVLDLGKTWYNFNTGILTCMHEHEGRRPKGECKCMCYNCYVTYHNTMLQSYLRNAKEDMWQTIVSPSLIMKKKPTKHFEWQISV